MKGDSKDVIANAFATARASCVQEHCARRYLAQQALERLTVMVKSDINQLPLHLQAIIGALTYGKTEVLWYFRNVNEVKVPWQALHCSTFCTPKHSYNVKSAVALPKLSYNA